MVEYQHINKTFWMPSIKLELTVEETEEAIKYSYYPRTDTNIYYNGLEASRVLRNIICHI